MSLLTLPPPDGNLHQFLCGTWWLLSREDHTASGARREDPVLGSDPVAILCYTSTHFAAQFMKRSFGQAESPPVPAYSGFNNTQALSGYDAYFGTYEVNEQTGVVRHTLLGSVVPSNIGMTVERNLRASEDQLIIQLSTTSVQGEAVIRTLIFRRMQ